MSQGYACASGSLTLGFSNSVNLGRRTFLQRLGLTLAALGVGETVASGWARRYYSALAQPTHRKLALLIGINQYPGSAVDPSLAQDTSLFGALTDVEMQRELLLYRFGFQPADVMVLTNQQATKSGIQAAFESHLQQARPGDVVVIHFSGYGSTVRLAGQAGQAFRSLVPADGNLPTEEQPELSDILEPQLQQWIQGLKTRQITTVLDAGYRDLGQLNWGTLRLRSRPTVPTGNLPTELGEKLPPDLGTDPWPGLLLRGSSPDRLVLEKDWSGFSAGVFSYALTQILWETVPSTSTQVILYRTSEALRRWTGPDQKPELLGSHKGDRQSPAYGLTLSREVADGVVTPGNAEGKVSLWLGGLPAAVLEHLQTSSRLVVIDGQSADGQSTSATVLKIKSRTGLKAQAEVVGTGPAPVAGSRLYEQVRVFPRNIDLIVALDSNLERIERVDATSAFSGIPFVSFTVSGDQPADCLFGRLPQVPSTTLTASLPAEQMTSLIASDSSEESSGVERSYGLFSPNRTLIPGTLIARDEAVKTAVNRLTPHLQSLLAMKLVRLVDNSQSSSLAVRAVLETTRPQERLLLQRETVRSQPGLPKSQLPSLVRAEIEDFKVPPDSRLRYRISNYSDVPLYFTLLSFDSRGQFRGLVPNLPRTWSVDMETAEADLDEVRVAPGKTQSLPENTMDWGVPAAAIWVETFLIVSLNPLQSTWKALRGDGQESSDRQPGLRQLGQPLQVSRLLLEDLHNSTVALSPELKTSEQYVLKTSTWATFSFRYAIAPTAD
ncbi:peptidase C14 [filamentous cyanobacterium CCP5]|nr:peptidase C14 [filamentous cyanobacterium CCP5]